MASKLGAEPAGRAPVSDEGTIVDQRQVTPGAVIGLACRLPNGIDSPDKLWDALLRVDDLVTEVPTDRWDAEQSDRL
ncbi:MAG: polyketide synthase 5 [Mycobacterium sp.]|jgi:polyketide synthase 5|nr:polyketide synthase 5 [Mycobacterium sp.]